MPYYIIKSSKKGFKRKSTFAQYFSLQHAYDFRSQSRNLLITFKRNSNQKLFHLVF